MPAVRPNPLKMALAVALFAVAIAGVARAGAAGRDLLAAGGTDSSVPAALDAGDEDEDDHRPLVFVAPTAALGSGHDRREAGRFPRARPLRDGAGIDVSARGPPCRA